MAVQYVKNKKELPMKKDITPNQCNGYNRKKVVAPSKQTLDFIKQFARSYNVAKDLPSALSGFCVN